MRGGKGKRLNVPAHKKTGIVLKQKYFKFLKSTVHNKLLTELNVVMKGAQVKAGGFQEIVLVEHGPEPKFDEAKVLIQNSVNLIESFHDGQNDPNLTKEAGKSDVIELEDVSSEDDATVHLKENINGLEDVSSDDSFGDLKEKKRPPAGCQVICEGSSSDGLCPVMVDTHGGPASLRSPKYPSAKGRKKDPMGINVLTTNTLNKSFTSKSPEKIASCLKKAKNVPPDSEKSGPSKLCDEPPIIILSSPGLPTKSTTRRRRKVSGEINSTIVLPDDTILISSCSESEDDILIEKVVKKSTPSPDFLAEKRKLKSSPRKSAKYPEKSDFIPLSSQSVKYATRSPCRNYKLRKMVSSHDVSKGVSGASTVAQSSKSRLNNSLQKERYMKKSQCKIDQAVETVTSESDPDLSFKKTSPIDGTKHAFDKNVISVQQQPGRKTGLRPIIIDGQNVSRDSGSFDFRKLEACIKYFQDRNHEVKALLPRHCQGIVNDEARLKMRKLEDQKILCFTPSRILREGIRHTPYDDRFIVQAATELEGIIVSNDNYRDLLNENDRWKETIEKRLLMYTWVGTMLMFPNDPLGRHGPHLDEFLRFPEGGE